jgi:hypothetical protein
VKIGVGMGCMWVHKMDDNAQVEYYIYSTFTLTLTPTYSSQDEDYALYGTVAHSIHRFSSEGESLKDDSRNVRPITAITQ